MNLRYLLVACLAFTTLSLRADIEIDSQDISQENIKEPAKRNPFSFDTHVDVIGTARISKGFYKKDKIDYAESLAELGAIVFYCPEYTEGLRVAAGFVPTYLKWHENPWFEQDHFNNATFTLSGFTKRAHRWFWRAQLTASFNVEDWSSKYTAFDITLWGRYQWCKEIGVHFGFIGETGMQMDRVYPIIGFDWKISNKLNLSLVFPVNLSLMYAITPKWSFGAAGRLINSRFRVNHDQHSYKPLVRYTNFGVECVFAYETELMTANIHAGSMVGGVYRVANHHNHHAKNYHFGSSPYAGAEVNMKF